MEVILTHSYFDLSGRTALVTGASSGLGEHFARLLSKNGAKVVCAARRVDKLEKIAAEINALAVEMDVTDSNSVLNAFTEAESKLGSLSIVVNNAGVAVSKPIVDHSEADWDHVIDTNLKGTWLVAQEAAKRMIESNSAGAIVNVASILGMRVAGGVAAYTSSKAAVVQLTQAMALELARYKIRVNALAPGYMETELNQDFLATDFGQKLIARIPQRRLGRLEELDAPILLLASDASAYLTGAILPVDGGHLVSGL